MAQVSFVCKHNEEKISQNKSAQIADFRKVTSAESRKFLGIAFI